MPFASSKKGRSNPEAIIRRRRLGLRAHQPAGYHVSGKIIAAKSDGLRMPEHDPERWIPVFGIDHAQMPPLWLAQAVQHFARGKTVRNLPDRGLKAADRDPRLRAQQPVGRTDIEAAPRQKLLHLIALVDREHALVARPALRERRAATHAVG